MSQPSDEAVRTFSIPISHVGNDGKTYYTLVPVHLASEACLPELLEVETAVREHKAAYPDDTSFDDVIAALDEARGKR